jgi:hypothetical protein
MTEETDKPRPVQIQSPGYGGDRTNDLRMNKDAAQRLIARYLREKMSPGDANNFANRIVDGIVSNMPMPQRPALRGWRMIDQYAPYEIRGQLASAFKAIRLNTSDDSVAEEVWKAVYRHGTALPDDIVL